MLRDKKTYSEFMEADEGIASNILIYRLKHLEAEAFWKNRAIRIIVGASSTH
jgi:DNA-binding HxlR family transcriptional regulator